MPLQQNPGLGVAMARPIIVDPTELRHCPGPETARHVAVFEHATHVLLRNADSTFRSRLHSVVVASSLTHHDVVCLAPDCKALTR
eukprot:3524145-Rhodomonas_salina.1